MKNRIVTFLFILILSVSYTNTRAADAYLYNLNLPKYIAVGDSYELSYQVRNLTSSLYSFSVSWSLDGGPSNASTVVNFGTGLGSTSLYNQTHPFLVIANSSGSHILKIWIDGNNETNRSNDTLTINLLALAESAECMSLLEYYADRNCTHCPDAHEACENIAAGHGNLIACFLSNDTYSTTSASTYFFDKYFKSTSGYTPAGIFNMGEFTNYNINSQSQNWEDEAYGRGYNISPVAITVNGILNKSTRELSVNITTNIKYVEDYEYIINAYILENGLTGSQAGVSGIYTYNNIVREMLGGYSGTTGVIPTNPIANTDYNYTYTYTIPSNWDIDNIYIIGTVYIKDNDNYYALNSQLNSLGNPMVSINPITDDETNMYTSYYNSSDKTLKIRFTEPVKNAKLSLTTIDSKTIIYKKINADSNEEISIPCSSIPSGNCIVSIQTKNKLFSSIFQKK